MAEYTTALKVRNTAKLIQTSVGGLTDSMIDVYIEEAEQSLNAIMGGSFLTGQTPGGFDRTKHGILESMSNTWAAMRAISFDTGLYVSLARANSEILSLQFLWFQNLEIVRVRATVDFLGGT